MKVYIVDDDLDIVASLRLVLERAGYQVGFQYDTADVIENIKGFKPDCLILDVMMPDNDSAGFEVARAVRTDEACAKLPILMLTAVNEHGIYPGKFSNRDRDDSWLPVNEFIDKPVANELLLKKVAELISAHPVLF